MDAELIQFPPGAHLKPLHGKGFRNKKSRSDTKSDKDKSLLHFEFSKSKTRKMVLSSFKPAQLYQGQKEWFVYYYFLNPVTNQFERFKERFDINRIKNPIDKIAYARAAVKFINEKLQDGFNPFSSIKEEDFLATGTILQQLATVIKIMNEDATFNQSRTYQTMRYRFENFVIEKQMEAISMSRVDIVCAKQFKNYLLHEKKLSAKTINATLCHLGLFWQTAIDKELTAQNPFRNIELVKRSKAVAEDDVFEPLTSEEVDLMFKFLSNNRKRNYVRFLAMIYCAWARPVEICRLKIKNFDLENDLVQFRKTETKNDKGGFVQLIKPLKKLLIEMELHKYDKEMYVFSTIDFMPGYVQKDPERATEQWNWWVVKKLGINKRMYALKHTGNIEYLLKNRGNVDLKWQQMQNRHSSAEITQRYNRKLGAYFIETKDLKFREI